MKSTFSILYYLKRSGQKTNGNMPILGRITVNGEAVQFSTKVEMNPVYWNVKAGKAIGKSKEVHEVNATLESIKTTMTKIYRDLQERETSVTPERIKNIFFGIEIKQRMLLDLFKQQNDNVQKLIGISKSKATYQKYEVTRKHLTKFIKERYNLTDISLKEINYSFIYDFEVFLLTTAQCNANTTAKFMQIFKRIIIIAKNNGWILSDPFANYKISIAKVDRGYLTQDELDQLVFKELKTKRLEQVRDIFVFSCYTGLAYIDVKNLREKNIRPSFDGNLWIMTKRQKTNVNTNVPLLDIPKQVLDKYKNTLPNEAVLPILSNQKMNAYLKEIADLCNINKNLTFHLARHTFATTITLAKGVPIESVSKMLGHTNIKTTQIYARITDGKLSHDMATLAKKLSPTTAKKQMSARSHAMIDVQFECLSLKEKMVLFNLPPALPDDKKREERLAALWVEFSEDEKNSLWRKAFENEANINQTRSQANQKLEVNQ
ncbi:MAG: site-specific integrase [Bacteroidota bacterium]|nr:site-specific integrase [Bacteroidota bacterium]